MSNILTSLKKITGGCVSPMLMIITLITLFITYPYKPEKSMLVIIFMTFVISVFLPTFIAVRLKVRWPEFSEGLRLGATYFSFPTLLLVIRENRNQNRY